MHFLIKFIKKKKKKKKMCAELSGYKKKRPFGPFLLARWSLFLW